MPNPLSPTLQRATALWQRSPFARNVTSTFAVQILTLVFATLNAAIIGRVLHSEGKGIVAMVVLVPSIFALFLSGGLNVANVYYIGQRRFDTAALTANAMAFTLLATTIGVLVTALLFVTGALGKALPGIPLGLLGVSMLSLPMNLLTSYFSGILQGLQKITAVNRVSLLTRGSTLLLTVLLVLVLHWGLTGAVLAVFGSTAITLVALMRLLQSQGADFHPRWNPLVAKTTLKFGLRGYIANVLQYFNYRLDLFLVNLFLGPAGVGIYTVSVALGEMLWYLPNAVSFVIFPKAANSSHAAMNRFTPRVFRATLGLTALGAVALVIIGRPFINIVYTSAFSSAYAPMLALLPGIVLLGGGKVLTNEIAGRGYPQYNSIASGVSLVATVVLDLLLIPRYGVLGASLASTLAYSTIFLLALYYYRRVSRLAADAPPATRSVTPP